MNFYVLKNQVVVLMQNVSIEWKKFNEKCIWKINRIDRKGGTKVKNMIEEINIVDFEKKMAIDWLSIKIYG